MRLFVSRLECALELVGKGSEALGRCLGLALGVLANVVLRQIRGNDSHANPFFLEVDAQDLDSYREADAHRRLPVIRSPGGSERRHVCQRFDARRQFDKGAEFRHPSYPTGEHLTDRVNCLRSRPGILAELLQSKRYLPFRFVDLQNLDRDLVARLEHFRGIGDARPSHLGDMQQTLDATTQIDECAEFAD